MNPNDEKTTKSPMRNANSYNHLGMVVLGFEERVINSEKQVYAVGFDLQKPDQKIAVAMMQEDGYRKNIAQINYSIAEKTNGSETIYINTRTKEELTKEQYQNFIKNDENVNADLNNLINSKRNAESLTTKKGRINQYPAVLMFDNANSLGQVGDMKVYEARWINGLSGNTARNDQDKENDIKNDQDFSVSHRKVLGNIRLKYNEVGTPVWADCYAIDRVSNLTSPHQTTNQQEFNETFTLNRDILRHALSNETKAIVPVDGEDKIYAVERKPFTYFNLMDSNNKVDSTVTLLTEEYDSSRSKEDDPIVKMHFKRPKDAPDTIEAYMVKQDKFTLPLQDLLAKNIPIEDEHKPILYKAQKADNVRAVISSLLGTPFQPILTKELAERASDPTIATSIAKMANKTLSTHRKLESGELTPRMINGTIYPLGHKYLERFVGEVLNQKGRPILGAFDLTDDNSVKGGRRINPHTPDNKLIFTPMYICPKKWENQSDRPSVFTGLVTVPTQSVKETIDSRVLHTAITPHHAPTAESFRLVAVEYKDYTNNTKPIPSINELLDKEKERALKIENTADAQNSYNNLYRLFGIHTPNGELHPKTTTPTQQEDRDLKPKIDRSPTVSFG